MSDNTTGTRLPEFDNPPGEPVSLFAEWFGRAVEHGVREPGALALATVDVDGTVSNRIVQIIGRTDEGPVFASHADSRKGRDIATTRRASGVLYWRETNQQVIITGVVEQLPDSDSDALWDARPAGVRPMSVVSRQSAPLVDEEALRERAKALASSGRLLPRPVLWVGYRLVPSTVEFWHGSPDRLHRRLRYERVGHGWTSVRLQP